MHVDEAVATRRSIRAFLDEPVDDDTVRELLTEAARAPSGGNLQPWRLFVVNGDEAMAALRHHLDEHDVEAPGYDIYPPDLIEPYRTNRFTVGEQMYSLLGIPRDDKAARLTRLAENYSFFGAPCGLFCFVDRIMGPPQWSDLGMFLQTFMLLARARGLDTCAQESWAMRSAAVSDFVGAPSEWMLFCGVALGRRDPGAAVNTLTSERQPLDEWARFIKA
ncbi:MAG: nitroreductase [Acidimicrobiia bacterium]|nr:nitroreductase [Acidimicrobiia bacterium]